MKRFIVAFLLTIILCTALYGTYCYGVQYGENNALSTMHISNIEQENGSYNVIIRYKDHSRLHVFYPWWLYGKNVKGE